MKRKKRFLTGLVSLLGFLLVLSFLLNGCPNTILPIVETKAVYSISVVPVEHGNVRTSANYAYAGDYVTVYVNPDPGWAVNSPLQYDEGSTSLGRIDKIGETFRFRMPAHDTMVVASFRSAVGIQDADGNTGKVRTIHVEPLSRGMIVPDPLYGYVPGAGVPMGGGAPDPNPEGSKITLYITPETGYGLKENSLYINDFQVPGAPVRYEFFMGQIDAGDDTVTEGADTFPRIGGAGDIRIYAEFEEKSFTQLKTIAGEALTQGQYDTAAMFYEAAYQKNSEDPEVLFYSTLGKLGNILLNPGIRDVLSAIGMDSVPASLNDWVSDKDPLWHAGDTPEKKEGDRWYGYYAPDYPTTDLHPDYPLHAGGGDPVGMVKKFSGAYGPADVTEDTSTGGAYLPKLGTPQGYPGSFLNNGIRSASQTTIGGQPYSWRVFWENLVFFNLVYSQRNGSLNRWIEDIQRYVFSDAYNEALARSLRLDPDEDVPLNAHFKEVFGLDEYLEADTVGRAELDMIFAGLQALKGALQFIGSYDLTIDTNIWLTEGMNVNDGISEILGRIYSEKERTRNSGPNHTVSWASPGALNPSLPFKNGFLKVRNGSLMTPARRDLSGAVNKALAAFDDIHFSAQARSDYTWLRDALSSAESALSGNGAFYYPDKLPEKGGSWVTSGNAPRALNVAKFFEPGAFTLTNWIVTEPNDPTTPALYRLKWSNHLHSYYGDTPVFPSGAFADRGVRMTSEAMCDDYASQFSNQSDWGWYGIYSFAVRVNRLKEIFPKGYEDFTEDQEYLSNVFPQFHLWPVAPTYFYTNSNTPLARLIYRYYHW